MFEWHHGQYMINHMQRVIEKAAEYEISIIKHEPIKDTGLEENIQILFQERVQRDKNSTAFLLMVLII